MVSVPVDLVARARLWLQSDETVVRADDVVLLHTATTKVWPESPVGRFGLGATARAYMVVTRRRLLFLPMDPWQSFWRRVGAESLF